MMSLSHLDYLMAEAWGADGLEGEDFHSADTDAEDEQASISEVHFCCI